MMAVEGIGSLVQALAEQVREAINSQGGADPTPIANSNNAPIAEDTFTPSGQNNLAQATPQDAGIFQVSQGALSAVTANILFAQTNPNLSRNPAPAQNATAAVPNAGNAQQPGTQNGNLPSVPGQLFGATPAAQSQAIQATPTTKDDVAILALNAGLPALGLSKVEIEEIDQIAQQTKNFNPTTYTDLINQFETLAQQAAEQTIRNAQASTSASGNQNTPPGSKTNTGNSQN